MFSLLSFLQSQLFQSSFHLLNTVIFIPPPPPLPSYLLSAVVFIPLPHPFFFFILCSYLFISLPPSPTSSSLFSAVTFPPGLVLLYLCSYLYPPPPPPPPALFFFTLCSYLYSPPLPPALFFFTLCSYLYSPPPPPCSSLLSAVIFIPPPPRLVLLYSLQLSLFPPPHLVLLYSLQLSLSPPPRLVLLYSLQLSLSPPPPPCSSLLSAIIFIPPPPHHLVLYSLQLSLSPPTLLLFTLCSYLSFYDHLPQSSFSAELAALPVGRPPHVRSAAPSQGAGERTGLGRWTLSGSVCTWTGREFRERWDTIQYLWGQYIVQELCESRGGRPGLSVLTSLLVSVDVKFYWTVLRHWSQLVPNMSTDIWGH